MHWRTEVPDGTVDLGVSEVLDLLFGKVRSQERSDHLVLAEGLVQLLQANGVLADVSLTQLACIALETGYFYRVFKAQNEVEIIEDELESDNPD